MQISCTEQNTGLIAKPLRYLNPKSDVNNEYKKSNGSINVSKYMRNIINDTAHENRLCAVLRVLLKKMNIK